MSDWFDNIDETPEVTFEVINRFMAFCEKRDGRIDERMRSSLIAVQQMLGWAAEMAWDRLPWWKRVVTDGAQWRWEFSEHLRERGRTLESSESTGVGGMLAEMASDERAFNAD